MSRLRSLSNKKSSAIVGNKNPLSLVVTILVVMVAGVVMKLADSCLFIENKKQPYRFMVHLLIAGACFRAAIFLDMKIKNLKQLRQKNQ